MSFPQHSHKRQSDRNPGDSHAEALRGCSSEQNHCHQTVSIDRPGVFDQPSRGRRKLSEQPKYKTAFGDVPPVIVFEFDQLCQMAGTHEGFYYDVLLIESAQSCLTQGRLRRFLNRMKACCSDSSGSVTVVRIMLIFSNRR